MILDFSPCFAINLADQTPGEAKSKRSGQWLLLPSTKLHSNFFRLSTAYFLLAPVPYTVVLFRCFVKKNSVGARVVDPDPYWIRIQLAAWIRIRIRNLNTDPDPGGQK